MQHQKRIFHAAGHGTELIERPAERHGTRARNTTEGGTKTDHAAAHARADDTASGFTADGESNEAGCGRGSGTGTGSRCTFFEQPWIHRLAAEPDVVQCEGAQAQFGDQDCARIIQPFHDNRVIGRHAISKRLGAIGRPNARRIEEILRAPRDAMERATIAAIRDLTIGLLRSPKGGVTHESDDATELRIESLDPLQIQTRQTF